VLGGEDLGRHGPAQVVEVDSQVDEQVVDRDHPHELLATHNRESPESVCSEEGEGIVQVGLRVDGDHRCGHDRVDPRVGRQPTSEPAADEITVGDDADQAVPVDDGQRTDAGLLHDRRGLADRVLWLNPDAGATHTIDRSHDSSLVVASLRGLGRRVLEVLKGGVHAGKEQCLVASVAPSHEIRRPAALAPHFKNLAVTVRFTDAMAPDHDAITHARVQGILPLL